MLSKLIVIMKRTTTFVSRHRSKNKKPNLSCQSQCTHTQNKRITNWMCQLRAESGVWISGKGGGGLPIIKEGRKVWWWLLCEFLLAPPSLNFSSLTFHHFYSTSPSPPPAKNHFVCWNGTWGRRRRRRRRRRRKDGIGALRTKMNMYVESWHGKKRNAFGKT